MPPCNCHPPFPRPEPFSPLPRPGKTPDWGKWIRDRLAEKGALLAYPSSSAFPDPGAGPNVYVALDTGVLYRWDGSHYQVLVDPSAANDVLEYGGLEEFPETGEHGKLYIAADTGSLYRWGSNDYAELLGGKADKAVPATEGNFAALAQDGNLVDSHKKPSDFADAENTYTKEETDEAIDRVAAYYITYTAEGAAFPTRAALLNAQTYYSGGVARAPTRNDYAIVLADESHSGAEWRYIYAVADGATSGLWEAQYPVEGVITFDNAVTKDSTNGVKSSGIWSALWGALTALPTGFTSLYGWVVNQLAGKQDVLTFDSKPKSGSTNPVTSEGILSALTGSTIVNRDMRNLKVAGLPASGTGYFVFRTGDNFDWTKAEWDSARSIWLIGGAGGGFLGLRTTANPKVYEAVHVDLRGTVTHIQDLDFDISDHLSFIYSGVSYTVFGVTDDELAKVSQLPTVPVQSVNGLTGAVVLTGAGIAVSSTDATKINAALAGKLGNSGAQTIENGSLTVKGNISLGGSGIRKFMFNSTCGMYYDVRGGVAKGITISNGQGTDVFIPLEDGEENVVALWKDVKAAVQQIAPAWVSGTAYTANALVTYNGVVYRCKANTVSPHTATPDADTTHWEAKPVSELFLPLTGGTMTGNPRVPWIAFTGGGGVAGFGYSSGNNGFQFDVDGVGSVLIRPNASVLIELNAPKTPGTIALTAGEGHNGNLAALDASGNPTDSTIPAANVALKSELRYSLINGTVTTGTDDTDPQNPITYGAVTLVDRAANFIQFTSDIDELRITLPAGVDGKVRDFGLAVNVNSGVTPPAITILGNPAIYNPDGIMPELAEGMNLLYFSEIGPYGLMLVKGEQVQQITQ